MTSGNTLLQEVAHIKNAASLLVHADGWFTDKAYQERGGRTYYAVDTDIINLFLSPKSVAKYADVFDQNNDTSQLLAWLLSDFIFLRADGLNIDRPFLLIPPHDEELLRTADALHRRIASNSNQVEVAVDNVLNVLKALISSSDEAPEALTSIAGLAGWLSTNAQQLIHAFEDRRLGPELELKRLAQLAREQVIQPIYGEVIAGLDRPFPGPDIENKVEDAEKFLALKSVWLERLRKHKPPRKAAYAIDRDAEVLARLEWANDELKAENVRLILITGANDIRMAAQEHPEKDFAIRYVRHPRSFLAAKEMFALSGPDDGTVKADLVVMEWLNLFFPDAVKQPSAANNIRSRIDRQAVKRILDDKLRLPEFFWESLRQLRKVEDSTPLNDYVLEWGQHIDTVAAARKVHPKLFPDQKSTSEQIAKVLLEHLKDSGEGSTSTQDKLYTAIYMSSVETLDQLYSAPTWIGLWTKVDKRKERIKGIPELRFDNDKHAQKYADSVMESLTGNFEHIDLVEMYGELAALDNSNYLAHVVHALAYASKGHWYATTALCRVAVAVRDCVPENLRGERKGREASYLAAVATRRIAKCSGELIASEQWLAQARQRDDAEKRDLRFDSEELAIRATRHFFARFASDPAPLELDSCRATCSELLTLISKIEELEKNEKIKRWLFRQCLTNLFSLEFITQQDREALTWSNAEDVKNLLSLFDTVTQNREQQSFSRHVFKLTYVMLGDSLEQRVNFAKEVGTKAPPTASPFDQMRFDLMGHTAQTMLKRIVLDDPG